MIFITLIDIVPGQDEQAYEALAGLKSDQFVTPLLIGRVFEESDILLLLNSDRMEALDDYLITNVRSIKAAQELVVVPIFEFTLLPSFDSVVEIDESSTVTEYVDISEDEPEETDELMLIMAKVDVAPGMDRSVHKEVTSLDKYDGVIPLMTGHTFHSKEFDLVLFFLSNNMESAWNFGKLLRSVEGVWDTQLNIIAHFEPMVPLEQFREFSISR